MNTKSDEEEIILKETTDRRETSMYAKFSLKSSKSKHSLVSLNSEQPHISFEGSSPNTNTGRTTYKRHSTGVSTEELEKTMIGQ